MTETGRALTVEAFAKVNRDLRVLGKRRDGYHEIGTIFQTCLLYTSPSPRD